jgi:alpha-L-fucosidase
MTMNNNWGFNKDDQNWKSTPDIARKLIDIASKGGNFLLNVGPTQEGVIPAASVTRLHEVGDWMKKNGACIYGTTKSPYRKTPFDGRCTVKGKSLYVEAFDWPENGLKLTGLKTPVLSAKTLSGEKLTATVETDEDGNPGVILSRPSQLDPIATVAVLQLAAAPEVTEATSSVSPDEKGSLTLKAEDAEVHGNTMQLQGQGDGQNLGYWTNASDYVTWNVKTKKADLYNVYVDFACDPGSAGATYAVLADEGDEKAQGSIRSTGSWNDFTSQLIGRMRLDAGSHVLTVKALTNPNGAVMNLKSVRLIPLANTTDD